MIYIKKNLKKKGKSKQCKNLKLFSKTKNPKRK